MSRHSFGACFALVLLFVILGCPAATAASGGDIGVVWGAKGSVSKDQIGGCPTGTGGPIGLPVVNGAKKAYYEIVWPAPAGIGAASVFLGPIAAVRICGQMDPTSGLVGAACGISAGHNGTGIIDYAAIPGGPEVVLNGLGWRATAGDLIYVTGGAVVNGTGKDKAGFLGIMTVRGVGAQCLNKSLMGKVGGITFDVDLTYAFHTVVPVQKHEK